jgi:hypothetical protein
MLTATQQAEMADRLKASAGTPFVFAVNPEPEPINFMDQVDEVLIRAGWKWEPASHDKTTGLILLVGPLKAVAWARSGMVVGIRTDAPKTLLGPADNLATCI